MKTILGIFVLLLGADLSAEAAIIPPETALQRLLFRVPKQYEEFSSQSAQFKNALTHVLPQENQGNIVTWQQLKVAADRGDKYAQNEYGARLYLGERGCPKDLKSAREYFKLAADQWEGIPEEVGAQSNYGLMLYYGEGGPQDFEGALPYLQRAAGHGDKESKEAIEKMPLLQQQHSRSLKTLSKKIK